jgi:CxxC motif-containing protein (DUF1111 family)
VKRKSTIVIGMIVVAIMAFTACSKLFPSMINPSIGICGPVSLTSEQTVLFSAGNDEFFANRTAATGLGPYFVATGCGSCHSSDNRGHPFTILTRFGQSDTLGNTFLAEGAPQLGTFCLPSYTPEQIPPGATSTRLIAPITAGVGFLEAVPDSEILALAAANQNNPDGVRGHPNWDTIPSFAAILNGSFPRADGKWICRFGRKAAVYDLLQQVANAYSRDLGVTSTYMPYNPFNYLDQTGGAPAGPPEVDNTTLNSVVFYCRCLAAPTQRNSTDSIVQYGGTIFTQIGCATCHQPTLTTGYSPIAALSYQTFSPFTDLLVHDMGPGLDDGYTEGTAETSEWRTAPLWGLGLAPNVQGGNTYLLHDGRAHSIEQAIEMHGGEAAASKGRFANLSASDKAALITFLKSL